ncbi:MAG: response regulator [Candidatus Omnitrophica bacterium]|nr:response regulator [Candidatus Omnitrophota bacterium]MBU1925907.1 response regulator [Candidatus Omnitrophota bacterium]
MKILIVDDDGLIVDLLQQYLKKNNYDIDTAFDGKHGLELLKERSYDIVFLDQEMPELTGLEIIEHVKQNNIKVKTVILSGYEEINEKFCKAVGADAYLRKPVELEEIGKVINKLQGST